MKTPQSTSWRTSATAPSILGSRRICRGGRGSTVRRWFLASRRATAASCWYGLKPRFMQDAIAREKQIKAGSRKKKLTLIEANNPSWRDLYEDLA